MSGDRCSQNEPLQKSSKKPPEPEEALFANKHSEESYDARSKEEDRFHGTGWTSGRLLRKNEVPEKVEDEFRKMGLNMSRAEILDSVEFNKNIAVWFGEKGFSAMRSFFRASVLNSLQKDTTGLSQTNCTDLEAGVVTLIADYLVKNGNYFTMSVFSNEVLRPLAVSNPTLALVLQRMGKYDDLAEPTLTRETASYVLRSLNVQPHSSLGAGLLRQYLEGRSGDLLSVLLMLLRDNAGNLNVREPAVRDDDVVAAFSEGLQDELGKLHCWFSNFNCQFVDVSDKLKKLICARAGNGNRGTAHLSELGEQELWNQLIRMDEHLKKQQECLMKMRDKERKKLAAYAKELEDLHQEMNRKLRAIQDYEKSLRIKEKALKYGETGMTSLEGQGQGDHMAEIRPFRGYKPRVETKDVPPQCLRPGDVILVDASTSERIMEENLELKATLREQCLRIDALTRKTALLSARCFDDIPPKTYLPSHRNEALTTTSRFSTYQRTVPHSMLPQVMRPQFERTSSGGLISAMSSALRRAKNEIDCLRNEQDSVNLQYERLLNNKLSKRSCLNSLLYLRLISVYQYRAFIFLF